MNNDPNNCGNSAPSHAPYVPFEANELVFYRYARSLDEFIGNLDLQLVLFQYELFLQAKFSCNFSQCAYADIFLPMLWIEHSRNNAGVYACATRKFSL